MGLNICCDTLPCSQLTPFTSWQVLQAKVLMQNFFVVVAGVHAAHVHELVPRQLQLGGVFAHVFAEEAFVEIVMPGGHGGVDGVERQARTTSRAWLKVRPCPM